MRIDCDLHWGHLHAAIKPRQETELQRVAATNSSTTTATRRCAGSSAPSSAQLLDTDRYIGGLHDDAAATCTRSTTRWGSPRRPKPPA